MTLPFLYLCLCSLFLSVTAANDWNKPCFSGVCEYDIPSANGFSSGTLKIWGTSSSIGDITPAAGWAILNCSQDALKQTIRIACMNEGSSGCQHLFGYSSNLNDAVGKVVRLPETCGMNAFGIITKATLDEDQFIPVSMVRSLTRRDGTLPTVHGLHISTNPSAVVDGQRVHFAIQGTSIPGAAKDPPSNSIQGRGLSSSIKHGIKNLLNEANSINDFIVQDSNLSYVDIDQKFTVTNETILCTEAGSRARATISVETQSHAAIGYSVYAAGTIIPPKVDFISLTGNMSANFDAVVELSANVSGTMDIAEIKLFEVGFPGLDFPGILSIGPSFEISSKGTVTLSTEVDVKFGINLSVNQSSFTLPRQNTTSGEGSFKLHGNVLKVSIGRVADPTGTIALHLIPALNFGIGTFGQQADTKVFLNIDAYVSATIGGAEGTDHLPRDESIPPFRFDRKNLPEVCFQADAGLSVNVGTVSDFFNLFDVSTQFSLYNITFPLLDKTCPDLRKRSWSPPIIDRERRSEKQTFSLQCLPSTSEFPLVPIIENNASTSSVN